MIRTKYSSVFSMIQTVIDGFQSYRKYILYIYVIWSNVQRMDFSNFSHRKINWITLNKLNYSMFLLNIFFFVSFFVVSRFLARIVKFYKKLKNCLLLRSLFKEIVW